MVAVVALTSPTVTLAARTATNERVIVDEAEYIFADDERSGRKYPLAVMVDPVAYKNPQGPGIEFGPYRTIQSLAGDPTPYPAYTDVDWAPSPQDAQVAIDKITRSPEASDWTGAYRGKEHGRILTGEEFIWLYTGSSTYATNVERCSRGAVALTGAGYGGKIDDASDRIDATAMAMQFTAGLSAALALLPAPQNKQHLFRGASEPPSMVDWLTQLANSGNKFIFPGLASTTIKEDWAISFMGKGPCRRDYRSGRSCVNFVYEFMTRQAKDVTYINPGEYEWILPPNREFRVVSITQVNRKSHSDYYKVQLQDF
jgi:hypothetical protein